MKDSLYRLLTQVSLLLFVSTSSLWASNSLLECEQASISFIQTSSQILLSKEERRTQLLKQKIVQYPTIICDENNLDYKIYIPKEIMFSIMAHMDPQVLGTFLATSQSTFELVTSYQKEKERFVTKVISSEKGIEAYRNSCLLGTLPCLSFKFYDGKGLPEEANTALHSVAIKNNILSNRDVTFLTYLKNLYILKINNNKLGKHTKTFSALTNLHTLQIEENNLSEHVTVLKALTNLCSLNVARNNLGKHVTALTALTNLRTLVVWNNKLGKHVTALASLTNLRTLNLWNNKLGKNMAALASLTNLRTLDVAGNNLGKHVTALASLTNLHTLNLWDNDLCEHVTALASLTNLHTLDLDKNNLGKHVTALASLTNLHILNLWGNNLCEQVIALASLTNLHTLNLGYNNLNEQVIAIFENLTNLKKLKK